MTAAMAALAPPKTKPAARREPIQKKMMVGASNDRMEQEADRVAARVGRPGPQPAAPPPTISRMSVQRVAVPTRSGPEEKDKPLVAPESRAQRKADTAKPAAVKAKKPPEERGVAQRKEGGASAAKPPPTVIAPPAEAVGPEGGEAPAEVEAKIQKMQARSAPGLSGAVRERVEEAVGSDLSDVRVHRDPAAAEAARELGARAFTVGRDMFFGQGEYQPGTSEGQRLIAHEATHTVQQRGGSAAARKIRRETPKTKKTKKAEKPKITSKTDKLEGDDWALDVSSVQGAKGVLTVPALGLPRALTKLKGEENAEVGLTAGEVKATLPVEGQPFTLEPQAKRADRGVAAAYKTWTEGLRKKDLKALEAKLQDQLLKQKDAGELINANGEPVYVLKRSAGQRKTEDVLIIGSFKTLPQHDSILRPLLARDTGGPRNLQADHILEDQLGGPDVVENMWLLDETANQTAGNDIKVNVDKTIKETLEKARAEQELQESQGVGFNGTVTDDPQVIKRHYRLTFNTVKELKSKAAFKHYWTRAEILKGDQLRWYKALTEKQLAAEGFEKGKSPTRINVFPQPDGGRPYPFRVASKGAKLEAPPRFFPGLEILEIKYHPDWPKTAGQAIAELKVKYSKKNPNKKRRKVAEMVAATDWITIAHDPLLGFGGYVTRESIRTVFKGATFSELSPITFSDVSLSPEGLVTASGTIGVTKALFPGLQVPIVLSGTDIFLNFPVPADKLSLGPVSLVDPAIQLGVGDAGFFIGGSTGIVIDQVGRGNLRARADAEDIVIAGDFALDLDFLDPASVAVTYSLAKDDFLAKAKLGVQKKFLPGVKGGQVEVTATRESFGLAGSLDLDGPLAGSKIEVNYAKETGLVIAGKDLPLPVEKLPGVSDAKVTVIVRRNLETGEWKVSGGGKASFERGGAKGSLDILFDGEAVDFTGRVDLAKGPASGWIQISASNRTLDAEGKPVEGAPTGPFAVWGKGEATVLFGKYLKGTVGIDYTREGAVILSGEVALAKTYDLFPKKDLSPDKPVFSKETPDFPIWGVKLGPVGVGIFAFGYASISAIAYVGPGQLTDAKLGVKDLDLDHPELATVTGGAKFSVPAFAGLHVSIGGGLKAQVAVAYAKGKLGIYGDLGLLVKGSFDVNVAWNQADGFAVDALAKVEGSPKFEFGVEGSLEVGVDLWLTSISKEWGPWKKPLGTLGPDIGLVIEFPVKWSEKEGLQLDAKDLKPPEPKIDAAAIMDDAFETLV